MEKLEVYQKNLITNIKYFYMTTSFKQQVEDHNFIPSKAKHSYLEFLMSMYISHEYKNDQLMMLTMVFPQMQEKFFTCIWHFKFAYEVLNWTMQSQTKACITNHHVRSALFEISGSTQ
jgi:hypothetical protein